MHNLLGNNKISNGGANRGGKTFPYLFAMASSSNATVNSGLYRYLIDPATGLLSGETLLIDHGLNASTGINKLVYIPKTKLVYFINGKTGVGNVEACSVLTGDLVYSFDAAYTNCPGLYADETHLYHMAGSNTVVKRLPLDLSSEEAAFTFNATCYDFVPSGLADYPLFARFTGGSYSYHKSKLAANDRVQIVTGISSFYAQSRLPIVSSDGLSFWASGDNPNNPAFQLSHKRSMVDGTIEITYLGNGTHYLNGACFGKTNEHLFAVNGLGRTIYAWPIDGGTIIPNVFSGNNYSIMFIAYLPEQ